MQWEDESLRSYTTRFNKKALLIDKADNKVLVTTFTHGLRPGEFLFSFYKNDPKMMVKMLYKAMKYMNSEDAMIFQGDRSRRRQRQDDPRLDQGRKTAQMSDRRDDKRSRP